MPRVEGGWWRQRPAACAGTWACMLTIQAAVVLWGRICTHHAVPCICPGCRGCGGLGGRHGPLPDDGLRLPRGFRGVPGNCKLRLVSRGLWRLTCAWPSVWHVRLARAGGAKVCAASPTRLSLPTWRRSAPLGCALGATAPAPPASFIGRPRPWGRGRPRRSCRQEGVH